MVKRLKTYKCEYCSWRFNIGYNRFRKEGKIYCSSCQKEIDYDQAESLAIIEELKI